MNKQALFLFSFFLTLASIFAANNVLIEYFGYSKCGDSKALVDEILTPLVAQIGSIIDLQPYYLVVVDPSATYGFKSPKGDMDIVGDIYEACALNNYPSNFTYFSFIQCFKRNITAIPENAEDCATELNLDYPSLAMCTFTKTGRGLLLNSAVNVKQRGVTYSPTVYINGKEFCKYNSDDCKAKDLAGWKSFICSQYSGTKPAGCN